MSQENQTPAISVIVLNYNGKPWIERCLQSLENQTIFDQVQVIVTDNQSSDGSDDMAARWLGRTQKGTVLQNGANLGYCEANNKAAALATGKYLFFLNQDTWLEPDCLEILCREVQAAGADGATPLVLDYEDNAFQSIGAPGIDLFGLTTHQNCLPRTAEIFTACGCSFLVTAAMFKLTGGFDAGTFMYADETDLSWRIWIAGGRIVGVPSARLHHRGATAVNPAGETRVVEIRTSETKRFLANRNSILFLVKNAQHVLLLLLIPHLLLLAAEALASLLLVRRWSYVKKSYLQAVLDAWRMRHHVAEWRRRIRGFRRRNDFWMLRFLCWKPSRWAEVEKLFHTGVPKVDNR